MKRVAVKSGFTIVELLIVVFVVAILAAIVVVAYRGVQSRAIDSSVRSTASTLSRKLESYKVESGGYPEAISTLGFHDSDIIKFQYSVYGGGGSFCTTVTSPKSKSVAYRFSSENLSPVAGFCDGHLPPDYEEDAPFVVPPREKTVHGSGELGLSIYVPESWDRAMIEWNSNANVQRYELQIRTNPGGSWEYRKTSDGSKYIAYSDICPEASSSCTGRISASTTTLNWTPTYRSHFIPNSAGQSFEFRLRYLNTSNVYSDWDIVTLANPVQSNSSIPKKVGSFAVTNSSDWTRLILDWKRVQDIATNMNEVKYELQVRKTPTGNWAYHETNTGSIYRAYSDLCLETSTNCSGYIPYSTTSLNWLSYHSAPLSAGSAYNYRIRIRIDGVQTYYSDWAGASLSNPVQSNSDVPTLAGSLSASSEDSWSKVVISWGQATSFAANMNEVKYELQVRKTPTGNWAYHETSTGSIYRAYSDLCLETSGNCSGRIPYNTVLLRWSNTAAIPPSGSTYEYRVRVRVFGVESYYGEWSTTSLTR